MTAVDLDTGNNARLTYQIVGGGGGNGGGGSSSTFNTSHAARSPHAAAAAAVDNAAELFGIFPNSGWIYLRAPLDRETRDRYDITVEASDNGTPSSSATAHVIVSVLDANDNDPVFARAAYHFAVEENLRRGAAVGTVRATDADVDENASVRYALIPSNTSFQINPVTGECERTMRANDGRDTHSRNASANTQHTHTHNSVRAAGVCVCAEQHDHG